MAVAKVKLNDVQKRSANSAIDPEEDEFLEDLRGLIWKEAGRPDGKWKHLAEKANLSDRTIARFASGETRRPQVFTIRRMIKAIDYVFSIQPLRPQAKTRRKAVKK